jgi:MFS transporter, DHA2 family, multidrug resistance protein
MIVYRAMQGFSGGAMMPLVFPVIYTKFRMPQLATVMVLISLILNLSSTLGPTIGGFLTDTWSWHWLFLVNLAPGILVAITVWLLIDIDKPELSLLRHFDLTGLVLMALFLGCLQYALQEGPRWDWLSDDTILAAVVVSSIASAFFFWRVLTYHQPIVDLRLLVRDLVLGLAVFCKARGSHPCRVYRVAADRHRLARAVDIAAFRSVRARADGAVSWLPAIRAPGRPAMGLAVG